MAYTAKTWVGGEPVTAAYMNRIERGIEEASKASSSEYQAMLTVVQVEVDDSEETETVYRLAMSAGEIFDAAGRGYVVSNYHGEDWSSVCPVACVNITEDGRYQVYATAPFISNASVTVFTAWGTDESPMYAVEKQDAGGDEPVYEEPTD